MAGTVAALRGKSPPKVTVRLGRRKRQDSVKEDQDRANGQAKRIKVDTPDHSHTASEVSPQAPVESTVATTETAVPEVRPKRNVNRPKRYSEDSEPSIPEKPISPPASGPRITFKQKPKPENKAPASDDEEDKPASYSADFLMNYIDDIPQPATPTPNKESQVPAPRRVSAPIPDNPNKAAADSARRESAPAHLPKSTRPAIPSPLAHSFTNDPATRSHYSEVVDRPPIQDDETTMIRKLDAAIFSLSRLNLPTPVSALFEQKGVDKQGSGAVRVNGLNSPARHTLPNSRTGTLDNELRILIHNAVNMLRASSDAKANMLNMQQRAGHKHRADPTIGSAMQADRAAMSALETLTNSSALNINCLASAQRAGKLWTLYQSLLFLINPPAPQYSEQMPPPARRISPQSPVPLPAGPRQTPSRNGTLHTQGTIEGVVDNFKTHETRGAKGPPPPHQFLLRKQQQSPESPLDSPRSNSSSMPPPPIPAPRGPQRSLPAPPTVSAR
ncbi:hypothetical protein KVT40_000746 [Elsinoe batatas]|uniref:Uncharacterized protein n=1 Tax=Elsinoe batatas TaxID=2601811 RepID=A0A8K0PIX7_9PEZI|nr:hypothetical protein KVT40_000746 [Elsinoe batatas]